MNIFWLITTVLCIDIKDQTLDKPELVKFLLPQESQYMDWWKITPENFKGRCRFKKILKIFETFLEFFSNIFRPCYSPSNGFSRYVDYCNS